MKLLIGLFVLSISVFFLAPVLPEAPTGIDNKTNGLVDDAMLSADSARIKTTNALAYRLALLCVSNEVK
jgi:hypothetical protein